MTSFFDAALADSKFAAAVSPASKEANVCLPNSPDEEKNCIDWLATLHDRCGCVRPPLHYIKLHLYVSILAVAYLSLASW